ncbi:hypothetical protein BN2476_460082 [Paraburkholderia piptadeniae]|uniref:Uncharacterized protein n=1 Tax=Paraburkholderia piptadeniae TaxID=1701573 RepID=A0A1N7SCU7_9BURK|nr:hypothetical protein BN2476_460082 [Paraburkholderia piptadeniae]
MLLRSVFFALSFSVYEALREMHICTRDLAHPATRRASRRAFAITRAVLLISSARPSWLWHDDREQSIEVVHQRRMFGCGDVRKPDSRAASTNIRNARKLRKTVA